LSKGINREVKEYAGEVAALVPYYDEEGGNSTRIYTLSGEVVEDRRSPRWILKMIARYFGADLEALREGYGEYLGCYHGVPLPLSEGIVLAPLRMRRIVGENDGASGYVNALLVRRVEPYGKSCIKENEKQCCVVLEGEIQLPCLLKRGTVEKKIRSGILAYERYRSLRWNHYTPVAAGTVNTVREGSIRFREGGSNPPPEWMEAMAVLWRFIKG